MPFSGSSSFNSRSRVGSDGDGGILMDPIVTFQFTLPCRERPVVGRLGSGVVGFNSRSRVGSDHGPPPRRKGHGRFNSRSRVGSDSALSGITST